MKKLTLLPILAALLSFTPKSLIYKATIAACVYEVKAQTYLTLADTIRFKPASYTPTLNTFGFSIGFDNTGIFYDAPRPDYRFNIDYTPILASVAISDDFRDLAYAPDVNNLPQYYHKYEADTLHKLSISNNTISIKTGNLVVNSIIIPSQVSQTITGNNGISINTGVNTFTVSKTKRQETYSGTTDASGNYTVTFGTSYSATPNIQANPIGGSTETFLKITSISTTGFAVNVFQRATVLSLALSTATTAINGAFVDVLITEK